MISMYSLDELIQEMNRANLEIKKTGNDTDLLTLLIYPESDYSQVFNFVRFGNTADFLFHEDCSSSMAIERLREMFPLKKGPQRRPKASV